MVCTPPRRNASDLLALQGGGAPDTKLAIDDRRGVKEQALGPARGAVVVDQRHRAAGQAFGQLFWLGDRRRATDDYGMAVVERADAPQTAQHGGEGAAGNA